jgi:hypothetical protein
MERRLGGMKNSAMAAEPVSWKLRWSGIAWTSPGTSGMDEAFKGTASELC